MPDASEIIDDAKNYVEEVEGDVEGYFYGENNTTQPENIAEALGGLIKVDADAEGCVDEDVVTLFWEALAGMLGVLIFTFLFAYLLNCCSKRCAGRWYQMMGMVHFVMGALLASFLMPKCDCVDDIDTCTAHKYNPGPVWGIIVMVIGFLLFCRGWCVVRSASSENAVETEGARLLNQQDEGGYKDDAELI